MDYADDVEHDEPTPETLLAATLTLQVAVDQLVLPGVERLDRSRAEADEAVRAVLEHDAHRLGDEARRDAKISQTLRDHHARALHAGHKAGMRRALADLIRHETRVRGDQARRDANAEARALASAPLPSLIEQLQDAVHTPRGGGNKAASPHRSAISFEAAELLGVIARTVWARPGDDLPAKIRGWCEAVVIGQNATVLPDSAVAAERWVTDARRVLTPDRSFEVKVDCPACGNRYVRVPDDTGGTMLKAAISVSYGTRSARCLACGNYWDSNHVALLASTLEHDRAEQEAG